jgi:hypothetical protein
MVVSSLVLGLTCIHPAGAAPSATSLSVYLSVQVIGAQRTLCVGDEIQLRAQVFQRVGQEGDYALGKVVGIPITGAVVGSGGVGSLTPASSLTRLNTNPPGAAYFAFKAEKPGTVILTFQARVNRVAVLGLELRSDTLKTETLLQIEDCKYRVSLISRWQVPGEANLALRARVSFAGMVEDGGGHYAGTARVQWVVVAGQVGDCQGTLPPDSTASLTGQVFGPDEFVIDVDFDPAQVPIQVDCRGTGGTRTVEITPAPVTFIVPTTGGNVTQSQELRGPPTPPGQVSIRVQRAASQ